MRAHINPATGNVGGPPPDVPAALPDVFNWSSKGLIAIPSQTPGGGSMVDLKGRFRTPLTATRGPDGKLLLQHLPKGKPSLEKE